MASPGDILVRLPSLTSKLFCEIWKHSEHVGPSHPQVYRTMTLTATTAPECAGQTTEWLKLTSGLPSRLGV